MANGRHQTCNHICHGLRLGCFGDGGGRRLGRRGRAGSRDAWAKEDDGGVPMELFMCVFLFSLWVGWDGMVGDRPWCSASILMLNPTGPPTNIRTHRPPKTALSQVLSQCLKTRMRVIYGVELVVDGHATVARIRSNSTGDEYANAVNGTAAPSSPPPPNTAAEPTGGRPLHTRSQASIAFARSADSQQAARNFQAESEKIGCVRACYLLMDD